jgi:hypothetical protein
VKAAHSAVHRQPDGCPSFQKVFKNPLQTIQNRATTNPDPSPAAGTVVSLHRPPQAMILSDESHQLKNDSPLELNNLLPILKILAVLVRGGMAQRVAIYARQNGTQPELVASLRQTVATRGANVTVVCLDDAQMTARGKYAGWRTLIAQLDTIDQIVVSNAGDIPGKTVPDLLKILGTLKAHDVGLYLHAERIDTGSASFAVLEIIAAYRRAKLSQAIRNGQARTVAAGKRIGRPIVPHHVQDRIQAALAQGDGVRPTARRFNISPASVINIRRAMAVA